MLLACFSAGLSLTFASEERPRSSLSVRETRDVKLQDLDQSEDGLAIELPPQKALD